MTTAARRVLLANSTVGGYTAHRVFKHRLEEKVDGTGLSAIVLKQAGGWATPDPIKTSEYPVLMIEHYADPSRLSTGEISVSDAEDRAFAMHRVVDKILHAQRGVRWGGPAGLFVVSCARYAEPVLVAQADQHSAATPLGDSVFVQARYALEVVH